MFQIIYYDKKNHREQEIISKDIYENTEKLTKLLQNGVELKDIKTVKNIGEYKK